MKFTDLFIRRPVLAVVVNLVILIAGLQSIRSLSRAAVPAQRHRGRQGDDRLRRRQRRPGARLHHHAARARDRQRRRHRLHRVVERPGREHDHRAPEAQLRHQRRAHPDPGEGRAGAQRPAARGRGAGHRAARRRTTQFAAMYLGFSSDDLDQNQITDYLTRVVQPKLSRDQRRAARRHPRRPHLRHAHLAEARHGWRRSASRPREVRDALAREQLPLRARAGPRARWCRSTWSPTPTCRPPRSSASSWSRRRTATVVRLGEIADVVLGAENYEQDVRFNGQTATFMGIWVLPTANSLDVIARVREAMPEIQAQLPAGMKAGIPYDSTRVHPGRHRRGAEDPDRDAAHRHRRHLPLPRLGARGDHPGRGDPDLARSARSS